MPYSVSTRPLTEEERKSLRQSSRFSLDDWAWVLFWGPSLGGTGYLAGKAIEWGFTKVGLVVAPIPSIVLATCGLLLGAYMSVAVFRILTMRARDAAADLRYGYLHVVAVKCSRVVQQKEFNDEGPIYFFDLGDERILLLWGQWLYNPHVGLNNESQIEDSDSTEEEDEPEFPCTEFVLHRCPALGRVLRLEVGGIALRPSRELEVHSTPIADMNDCEVLVGNFEALPNGVHGKSNDFAATQQAAR
jgi:hypothetical protein